MPIKVIACCLLIYACVQPARQPASSIVNRQDTGVNRMDTGKQLSISQGDTVYINTRCAVMVSPDSQLLEKRKKELGEEMFQTGYDDYAYYMNQCYGFFEKHHLPIIETRGSKYISFSGNKVGRAVVRTDTLEDLYNIYLFDPSGAPYLADMIMIDDEYAHYFGKDSL